MIAFVYRDFATRDAGIKAFRYRADIRHIAFCAGTMGSRFNLIVMLADPHYAETETQAIAQVDWYNTAMLTRLAPNGNIVDAWEGAA